MGWLKKNFVFKCVALFRWESHNKVHGLTRNAYDSNRIVGGSSGGEGCLLVR